MVILIDGGHIPGDAAGAAFEYGSAVPSAETGMALPNVQTLSRVQGWAAKIDPNYGAGTRMVLTGVETTSV